MDFLINDMKRIDTYIIEKLHINKDVKDPYNYHPKNNKELIECIMKKIKDEGLGTKDNPLNLNDIDTSEITSMKNVFNKYNALYGLTVNGVFDVSKWDVSNVIDMSNMFMGSNFNGDISKWDVSNVTNMRFMFSESSFTNENGNIDNWKVSKDTITDFMFSGCPLAPNPPKWYINK